MAEFNLQVGKRKEDKAPMATLAALARQQQFNQRFSHSEKSISDIS